MDANLITVDDYVGKKLKKITKQYSVNYLVIGDGDTIISQSPEKGEKIRHYYFVFRMISLGILLYARSDRKSLIALPGVSFDADCKSTVRSHS